MKIEFSKKFAVGILVGYALLVFCMVGLLTFINIELGNNFIGILGFVTPLPLAVIGFYYQKAKTENILKIQNSKSDEETKG